MKKFQFQLEQVLQQRIEQEEQALHEKAKAQQECQRCQDILQDFNEKLDRTIDFSKSITKPEEQMHMLMYRDQLQSNIERQVRLVQRAEELLQMCINAMVKARQERMVLEKLKEKQYHSFLKHQDYMEQKEVDELATLGYGRHKLREVQ